MKTKMFYIIGLLMVLSIINGFAQFPERERGWEPKGAFPGPEISVTKNYSDSTGNYIIWFTYPLSDYERVMSQPENQRGSCQVFIEVFQKFENYNILIGQGFHTNCFPDLSGLYLSNFVDEARERERKLRNRRIRNH